MKSRIQNWEERFNNLNLRERLLLTLVVFAVLYVVFDTFIMASMYSKKSNLNTQIKQWTQRNIEVKNRVQSMTEQLNQISQVGKNSQVMILKAQLGEAGKQLEDAVVKFVRPQQMVQVLKNMLDKDKDLRLMQLQSQAPVALFLDKEEGKSVDDVSQRQQQVIKLLKFYHDRDNVGVQADYDKSRDDLVREQKKENMQKAHIPQVYKHGVLIKMRGTFSSTLRYLKSLEKLPWHFYWDAVKYEVLDYPKAEISILINTLSLDEDWVRV